MAPLIATAANLRNHQELFSRKVNAYVLLYYFKSRKLIEVNFPTAGKDNHTLPPEAKSCA